MAIFSKKPKAKLKTPKTEVSEKAPKAEKKAVVENSGFHSGVLRHPRVTEKASFLSMNKNIYVFEVGTEATKKEIKKAVLDLYKVHPLKIAITKIPKKNIFVRGKAGVRSGGKKAYVYLKEGDKIEIV